MPEQPIPITTYFVDNPPPWPAETFRTRVDHRTHAIWLPREHENPLVLATERYVGNRVRVNLYRYDQEGS